MFVTLRRWFRTSIKPSKTVTSRPRPLFLELLEDRRTPANFVVNTLSEYPPPPPHGQFFTTLRPGNRRSKRFGRFLEYYQFSARHEWHHDTNIRAAADRK
jgi:hypothetical protein